MADRVVATRVDSTRFRLPAFSLREVRQTVEVIETDGRQHPARALAEILRASSLDALRMIISLRQVDSTRGGCYSSRVVPEVMVNLADTPLVAGWLGPEMGWPSPIQTSTVSGTTLRTPLSSTVLNSRS